MPRLRLALLAALLAALALAPGAAACTVEPVGVHQALGVVEVAAHGPCPPAYPGAVYLRVLDQEVRLDLPF